MAPGETRSRPIRERQSVCPIRRMRAEVRKGTQERKTGLPAGHWETVLDGEVLRELLGRVPHCYQNLYQGLRGSVLVLASRCGGAVLEPSIKPYTATLNAVSAPIAGMHSLTMNAVAKAAD
jgi:hypothetical protein